MAKVTRPPLRDLGPPPPTRGPRASPPRLARFAGALVADLARRTRYVDPDIAARWTEFAGPELSRLCRPGRLTGGQTGATGGRTLEVIAPNGAAATSVEFASEALRRRLNEYFGPDAIARITVIQGTNSADAGGMPKARPGLSRFRASDD